MKYFFSILLILNGFSIFSQSSISQEDKLFGLSMLWQEVNYNFAFFDQVPEIDWNAEYKQAMIDVLSSKTDTEYYIILQKLLAKLNDGHTQVYFPKYIEQQYATVPILVEQIDGHYYIKNKATSLPKEIKIGSEIVTINHQPIQSYVANYVQPNVSSSTQQGYKKLIEDFLFYGPNSEPITLELVPPNTTNSIEIELNRQQSITGWKRDINLRDNFNYRKEQNISIVSLRSFEDKSIVSEFEQHIPQINKTDGLVIDLRENIGGQAVVALNISKYLVSKPQIVDLKWQTKHHVASHKAWGNSGLQIVGYDKVEEFKDYGELDAWITVEPDTLFLAENRQRINVPIKILINENTASSAENFLVFLHQDETIETIGTPTFGSTGQPIYFELPGGGFARICAKRNYFPDGSEFVGYGIQPTATVKLKREDIISNRDAQLIEALKRF